MAKRQDASTGQVIDDGVESEASSDVGGKPTMYVKVYAPFQMYFEGRAFSVSGINETGPFDILPKHHNFICMLVPCNLVVKPAEGEDQKDKTIKVSRALMHVKADSVTVFIDV